MCILLCRPYTLNGEVIKVVYSVRYLGHIISNDGKDDRDIMRQCQQLYARGNVVLRKFHMCSMDVKVKLFNTYCSPMYTAQLLWNPIAYSFQRLNVCYNNILRRLSDDHAIVVLLVCLLSVVYLKVKPLYEI